MTTPPNSNATVVYEVESTPANTTVPADNFSNELSAAESTGETAKTTPADNRPMNQKEKVKVGGLGAAAGIAAAMTYGADTLHSIEEAGANAFHSVENFLGINTDEPDKPAHAPAPPPPVNGQENVVYRPGSDPHGSTSDENRASSHEAHHTTATPPPQPENAIPVPGPDPNAPDNGENPANGPEVQHTTVRSVAQPGDDSNHQDGSQLVDLDGDGKADAAMVVDEHGNPEMIVDMDHDGVVDGMMIDGDHDGHLDTFIVDANHDGYADSARIDSDHDDKIDKVIVDSDGDHGLDTIVVDSNHDGHFTADDTIQATGHNPVIAFTDHQQETNTPSEGDIAHQDQPSAEDYQNDGDVHEWA